ncbi:Spy0128 family protein [Collinsella sp. LCP19S3_C6]|uniref:Spy0128 family protein n=1 Tax=Collinsella sp. LCP19S3_C6 TaxID=3438759 RepID=UPI003F8E06F8
MFKHEDRKDGDTKFAKGTGVASTEMPQRRYFRRTRLKAAFAVKIALVTIASAVMVMQTMPVSAIAEAVEQEQQDQQLLAEVQSANEGSTTNVGEGDNTGSNGNATNDSTYQGDATPGSDTSDSSSIDDSDKTDGATAPAANAADSIDADSTGVVDASNFDSPNVKLVAPPAQSEQALAAQASPSALRAAKKQGKQEPQTNNQNPITGDDQRIDNISVAWVTPDDAEDGNPARLSLVPKTDEFSVKMKLSVALSGQYSYKEGEIQIVVPKYIFADRDGKPTGELEAAVPEAPSQQSTFAYTEIGDGYVLSNTCELSAAMQANFEFSVNKLDPVALVGNGQLADGSKSPTTDVFSNQLEKYVTDNFYGTVNLTTHAGNVLSMTSNKLNASVDTQETIDKTELRGQSLSETWPSSWPEELKPTDDDKYIYVDWYSWTNVSGNQKYVLQGMTADNNSNHKPKLLGVRYNGETVANNGEDVSQDVRFTAENSVDYVSPNNSTGYLHTYMAYPKDQFELGGHYELKHKVNYTLTSADDRAAIAKSADATFKYSPIEFKDPGGHFNVFKYSNGSYSSKHGKADYPYALDSLRSGNDVVCEYDVKTVGFTGPWTTDKGGNSDYNKFLAGDYGKQAVRMDTVDYSVNFDHTDDDLTADDFEFEGVSIDKPTVYNYQRYSQSGKGYYEASDGTATYGNIEAGSYGYVKDGDNANQPDIEVYGSVKSSTVEGDNWVCYGTVSYSTGTVVITPQNGATVVEDGKRLVFPRDAGVTDIKTGLSTKSGGVIYTMHPYVRLKPTERVRACVDQLFKDSDTPETILRNTAKSYNYDYKGNLIVECGPKSDDDFLTGAASGISMDKSVRYDTDKDRQKTTLHYTVNVYEQTNLTTLADYNNAVAAGAITPDTAGTFYDLLPKGVEPKLGTVKLNGDNAVESVSLKRNYKGTGRTLMTVKARVNPNPEYRSRRSAGNQPYDGYGDKITLTFDAVYSFDTERDYGSTLVNNIAYESAEPSWGTIAGYKGEPDNPLAGNNQASKDAVKGVEDAMTDLDPESDNSSFVYARVSVKLDHLSWSVAQLDKKVDTNDEGAWSSGLDKDGARNVYENGAYNYRISLNNPDSSGAKDICFFDALDAFDPSSASGSVGKDDVGDITWKGHLQGVDVSALTRAGADAHVYYSTLPASELKLDAKNGGKTTDLTDRSVWTPAESYAGSLDEVTAVAVDATKKADGNDFVVGEGDTASFTIRMRAPRVEDLEQDSAAYSNWFDTDLAKGESESGLAGGAHAYNSSVLRCTTISNAGVDSPNQVIRKEYTKVGLKPFGITVKKAWSDSDDQDGKRPQSVTVHLYADGQDTGKSAVLSDANNWQASFGSDDGLCVLNDEGDTIAYSVKEETPEGYLADVRMNPTDRGYEFTVTNKHRVETIEIAGRKIWDDANDAAGKRPKEVKIDLYADGELVKSKTVKAADSGDWNYSFGSLPKYRDHGIEIAYEVREDTYYEGYVTSIAGTDVTNTYNPYGTLKISKAVQDATDVNAQKEFSFKLTLATPEGEPEGGTFAYTVTDAAGAQVATGKVGNGDSIKLRGGQTATIPGIPSETTYQVTEAKAAGFKKTDSTGATGTIRAGEERAATASFTNTYNATGKAYLSAMKVLRGRKLKAKQFTFDVVDEAGNIVVTARNGADGAVNFGAIKYGLADVGKTYTYTIRERNTGAAGYTYSDAAATATVSVTDNGDGTLACDVSYGDGSAPTFTNAYHASGAVDLKAWKTLEGRDLKDNEFTFKLEKLTGEGDSEQAEAVGIATNSADGKIVFSHKNIQALQFTEADADKTYRFRVSEDVPAGEGADPTVDYDSQSSFVYTVKVVDSGDGTLGFDVSSDAKPVFKNKLKDGKLRIAKTMEGDNPDPNKEFTFRVQLTGKNLPEDGSYSFKREAYTGEGDAVDEAATAAAQSSEPPAGEMVLSSDGRSLSALLGTAAVAAKPVEASASAVEPLGAQLAAAGTNNEAGETAESEQTSAGVDDSSTNMSKAPARARAKAKTAAAEDPNIKEWYGDFRNGLYEDKEIKLPDVSVHGELKKSGKVGSSKWYLYKDGAMRVKAGEFNWLELINVIKTEGNVVRYLELEKGCTALDCQSQYTYLGNLVSIVGYLSTPKATDMSSMFSCFSALTSLNLSGWNTSKVTDMNSMFEGCSALTSLDLSGWNTSKVTDMDGMFYGCSALTSLNLSNFDTSKVTTMESMFEGCSALTSLDLSGWNTSKVTDMGGMFYGCSALTSLDLSGWNTSEVISMYEMFYGCSALTSLGLSDFDTSKVSTMESMFEGCSALKSLDLSGWNTPKVIRMYEMFEGCSALTSLDLSNFDTSKVTSMDNMFYGCKTLNEVVLGGETRLNWGSRFGSSYDDSLFTDTWVCEQDGAKRTSSELADRVAHPGTWNRMRIDFSYTVNYAADSDDVTGEMASAKSKEGEAFTFPKCMFYLLNYEFAGWKVAGDRLSESVDQSKIYQPGDVVEGGISHRGGTATLTAQWKPINNNVDIKDGSFDITLRAGEAGVIDGLPAGTGYSVYEKTPAGYKLVSSSDTSGTIDPAGMKTAVFTNGYAPDERSTSATIAALKTLDGEPAADRAFNFTLTAENGAPMPEDAADGSLTVANGAGGAVNFGSITYDEAGTYGYTVSEVPGADANVTYDGKTVDVTVEVKAADDGSLSADVTYDGKSSLPVFANKTKTVEPHYGSLTFTKKVEGAPESDAGRKFKFRVDWDSARDGEEFALAAGESKTWEDLDPGLGYTITELDVPAGYKASGAVTGSIEADKQSRESITNTYTVKPKGSFTVSAKKTLEGRELKAGEFTFELVEAGADGTAGKTIATATNDGDGNVAFPSVTVASAGEHRYLMREKAGSETGVAYDTGKHYVTVTASVATDDPAKLDCSVKYEDGGIPNATPTFTNTYKAPEGSFTAKAVKKLDGRKLTADDKFTFELLKVKADGSDGDVVATAENDTDGNVMFPSVTVASAGEHRYRIREKAGSAAGITYDKRAYDLTVTARASQADDSKLECTVAYIGTDAAAEPPVFTNSYEAKGTFAAHATKSVKGADLKKDAYTFELLKVETDGSDGEVVATAKNDAEGNVTFGDVTVTSLGEHRYRMREVVGDEAGMAYDTAARDLTVTATDAGNGKLDCEVAYEGGAEPEFVNVFQKPGTFVARAHKALDGRDLKEGEFEFELVKVKDDGSDGEVVASAKNDAKGNVVFGKLSVDAKGRYKYRIREKAGKDGSVIYDKTEYDLDVVVTDDTDGNLSCQVVYGTPDHVVPTFTNNIKTPEGSFKVESTKRLEGRKLKEGEFEFELVEVEADDSDGDVVATAKNDADGKISFGKVELKGAGERSYRIREVKGSERGVTYDTAARDLTVKATDNGDGTLKCVVSYEGGSAPVFTNKYTVPKGSFRVEASKVLEGRKLKAGEFEFELVKVKADGSLGKVVATAKNGADGKVEFSAVELTGEGTRSYRIREVKGDAGGVTYDGKSYGLTVDAHMSEGDDAKLDCTVSYDGGSAPTFTNAYRAKGSFKAEATKKLDGRELKAGEFAFELVDADCKVVATAENKADGSISFPEVELTSAGTYGYRIREAKGDKPGVAYDENEYGLTVAATDNGDGTLRCDVSYDGGSAPTFANRYEARGSFNAQATKRLDGRELKAGEFEFELVDADGKVAATAENKADGSISFPAVELTAAGTYAYSIREKAGSVLGVSYDSKGRGLTVRATDNGDGTLRCDVSYDGGPAPTFTNRYEAKGSFKAQATKRLDGRELKAGEFEFELIGLNDDGTEGDVVATAENDAAGNVVFPAVEVASAGTYRYRVREKAGSESGVTYDTATYDLTVTAVDNGDGTLTCSIAYANGSEPQFVNTYTPPINPPANPPSTTKTTQTTTTHKRKRGTMPSTGDDTWALACGMVLAGSVTCALGIASRRRKRR